MDSVRIAGGVDSDLGEWSVEIVVEFVAEDASAVFDAVGDIDRCVFDCSGCRCGPAGQLVENAGRLRFDGLDAGTDGVWHIAVADEMALINDHDASGGDRLSCDAFVAAESCFELCDVGLLILQGFLIRVDLLACPCRVTALCLLKPCQLRLGGDVRWCRRRRHVVPAGVGVVVSGVVVGGVCRDVDQ